MIDVLLLISFALSLTADMMSFSVRRVIRSAIPIVTQFVVFSRGEWNDRFMVKAFRFE